MIILDDKLALDALAGRIDPSLGGGLATTWGFHYRLVRALRGHQGGHLSSAVGREVIDAVIDPPPAILHVLDPRLVTATATEVAARHGLNLLAAELMGAALVHRAGVRLSRLNVGRGWPAIARAERIALDIVD